MAATTNTTIAQSSRRAVIELLIKRTYYTPLAILLLAGEVILNRLIIKYVRYTEIDWIAYIQEVEGYLSGETDYTKLRGDTGPLVYPAGFVHSYSLLYHLTRGGKDVRLAQYIFAMIYVLTMAFVFGIYKQSRTVPSYTIILLTLSKRLHSIYVLRLFNDGLAMLGFYISLWCLIKRRWNWSAIWLSLALSVKMNVLLVFPAFGLIYLQSLGFFETLRMMLIVVIVQVLLAIPFLRTHPYEYLSKAFEFTRRFDYQWTVNWRMISAERFRSSTFGLTLNMIHLTLLAFFAWTRWCGEEGPIRLLGKSLRNPTRPGSKTLPTIDYITKLCFTCNLIGVICARTLHYQFYSWYAHQIVYLLWQTPYALPVRILLMFTLEYSWNVYPSTVASSCLLLGSHSLLLAGLWWSVDELEQIPHSKKKKSQ